MCIFHSIPLEKNPGGIGDGREVSLIIMSQRGLVTETSENVPSVPEFPILCSPLTACQCATGFGITNLGKSGTGRFLVFMPLQRRQANRHAGAAARFGKRALQVADSKQIKILLDK